MKKIPLLLLCTLSAFMLEAKNEMPGPVSKFPNYHPLIVHFPIVLLIVAMVMQVAVFFFQNKAFNYAVVAFGITGFLTALLSATLLHADPSHDISPAAMSLFEQHEKLAFFTIWLSGIAGVFKVSGLFIRKKWVEVIAFLLLLACATTVTLAGHRGAELVYKQGVGPRGENVEVEHES